MFYKIMVTFTDRPKIDKSVNLKDEIIDLVSLESIQASIRNLFYLVN